MCLDLCSYQNSNIYMLAITVQYMVYSMFGFLFRSLKLWFGQKNFSYTIFQKKNYMLILRNMLGKYDQIGSNSFSLALVTKHDQLFVSNGAGEE